MTQSVRPARLMAWAPDTWAVGEGWQALCGSFFSGEAGQRLGMRVQARIDAGAPVYPPEPLRALALTPLDAVRVVIVGQDPYHGPGQAQGLAFSVPLGERIPPSLRNVFKELQRDLGVLPAGNGCLERWARQGVLLLNTSLTVEDGLPASHARWGWEIFTNAVIAAVARRDTPCVFMLWGAHAQARRAVIEAASGPAPRQLLMANHPSPLSALRGPAPFLGCGHFGAASEFLRRHGVAPPVW